MAIRRLLYGVVGYFSESNDLIFIVYCVSLHCLYVLYHILQYSLSTIQVDREYQGNGHDGRRLAERSPTTPYSWDHYTDHTLHCIVRVISSHRDAAPNSTSCECNVRICTRCVGVWVFLLTGFEWCSYTVCVQLRSTWNLTCCLCKKKQGACVQCCVSYSLSIYWVYRTVSFQHSWCVRRGVSCDQQV